MRRVFRFLGIVTLVAHGLMFVNESLAGEAGFHGCDFTIFYNTAVRADRDEPIYTGDVRTSLRQPHNTFFYPPTFVALVRPLAYTDIGTAGRVWYTIVFASFWMLAFGLARLAFVRPTIDHVLGVGAALHAVPGLLRALCMGNVDVVVWALIVWALTTSEVNYSFRLLLRAYPIVLLVLASWIKFYPIFGLAVLVFRCGFSAFSVTTLLGGLVTVAVVSLNGWHYVDEWLRYGLRSVSSGCFHWGNWSLTTLILRPFVNTNASTLPAAAHTFLMVAPAAGIAAVAFWAQKFYSRVHVVIVIVASIVLSPVCWVQQLGFLVVAPALWWRWKHRPAAAHRYAADAVIHGNARWQPEKLIGIISTAFAQDPKTFVAYQAAVALGCDEATALREHFPAAHAALRSYRHKLKWSPRVGR